VTSTLVDAGAIGYDAAGFVGLRPSGFAAMKAAGASWVSLYIGGKFGVTSATIEAAWNAGLQVSPNYERAATLGLGGDTAGANAAVEARSELEALGFVGEATVFFSFVDFAATTAQYPILDACVQGCLANWPDNWVTPGMYGDGLWLNHLAQQPWWDGPLWYWAGDPQLIQPACTVKQRLRPTLDTSGFGVAVDEDVTIQPVRMWTGYGPDPLDPAVETVKEEVMLLTNSEVYPQFAQAQAAGFAPPAGGWPPGWLWWELTDTGKKWVYGDDFQARYDWAVANSVQGVHRTTGQLQSIPDWMPPTAAVDPSLLAAVNGVQSSVSALQVAVASLPTSWTATPTPH
jgi:hypothetical protein